MEVEGAKVMKLSAWGFSVEFNVDDLKSFFTWSRGDGYLDYSTANAESSYGGCQMTWLQLTTPRERLRVPYEVVIDYRNWSDGRSSGNFEFRGDYEFPAPLVGHREAMIRRFEQEKRLAKRNNPAPRVAKLDCTRPEAPLFVLEHAWYYDQVGTNLTLDYPLNGPIEANGFKCKTVREWDVAQAGQPGCLPSFGLSRLANTVGVAVGITAKLHDGRPVVIRRKRRKDLAVYTNVWHVPFSFALTYDRFVAGESGDIKDLIQPDFGHELADELGLEWSCFHGIKPLAFCRDLARGGKPQFFFEMQSVEPFEKLREEISDHAGEFTGRLEGHPQAEPVDDSSESWSPELAAFALLKSGGIKPA
jgi:hypothetical protein